MTLDREDGMYGLYSGNGLRQAFDYTSKGELKTAITGTLATPAIPLPGRSLALSYDGEGNRNSLHVDNALSHQYTPGLANEYTAVSYDLAGNLTYDGWWNYEYKGDEARTREDGATQLG